MSSIRDNAIGIVGASGSGKTSALRNMPSEQTFILSPKKTSLPFPGASTKYTTFDKKTQKGNFVVTKRIQNVAPMIKFISDNREDIKFIVLEDITHYFNQYTLNPEFRAKAKSKENWSRWEDFGADIFNSIFAILDDIRPDLTIIYHFHPETHYVDGVEKFKIKTPGNLLERSVDIPSYFDVLLYTKVLPYDKDEPDKERYLFVTNDDGFHPAKTPMGMFNDMYILNDTNAVINQIKEYDSKNN